MENLSTMYLSTYAIASDAILVGVLLVALLIGSKVGLFRSLMSFVTVLVAMVGATHVTDRYNGELVDWIYPKVSGAVTDKLNGLGQNRLSELMQQSNLPDINLKLLGGKSVLEVLGVNTEKVAKEMIGSVTRGIMMVVLFIILLVVLNILVRGINQVLFKIPVVSQLNHVGGAVLAGLVWGFLMLLVVYLLERSLPDYWVIAKQSAPISRFVAEHNPIQYILETRA